MKKILLFLVIIIVAGSSCNTSNSDELPTQDSSTRNNSLPKVDDISSEKSRISKDTTLTVPAEINLSNDNEKIIFAFKTEKGKSMNLVLDNDKKYMAYRFGADGKVELQFPENLENTFGQFTYNYS